MARPWNNWYHCMGHTYGSWLRGDPRGWRARHHREHVEGDYKNPPPVGTCDGLHEYSKKLMKRPPVVLSWEQRVIACCAMGERLLELRVELIDLCVTAKHFHVLARFTPLETADAQSPGIAMPGLCAGNALQDGRDPVPRHAIGLAKKHASFELRSAGMGVDGGVWAVRCKCEPIEGREHQLWAAQYIRDHANEGGAVHSVLVERPDWRG